MKDLISGGALFIFALVYGLGAGGLADSGDPAVALVPIGLAAALALLASGIALSGWRKPRRESVSEGSRTAHATGHDAIPTSAGPRSDPAGPGSDPVGPDADPAAPAADRADLRFALARLWNRRAGPTRAWTVVGLTILYAALFQTLGYVLATLLYTGAVAERFGARRRAILVIAPCVTLLTYVLFRVVLGARLPEGLLG